MIGTLLDVTAPPKTARYPWAWTVNLVKSVHRRPRKGSCFLNAFRMLTSLAERDGPDAWRYVEGWVWAAHGNRRHHAVPHAWLEDQAGRVLDVTPGWGDEERAAYLGAGAFTPAQLGEALAAGQNPPRLHGGPDWWEDDALGRHMALGLKYAIMHSTGISLAEQAATADRMLDAFRRKRITLD